MTQIHTCIDAGEAGVAEAMRRILFERARRRQVLARNGYFYGTAEFGGNEYDVADPRGDGSIFRFALPLFQRNPLAQAGATVSVPYAAALSTNAILPSLGAVNFTKVSGPAWLTIAGDGSLTGVLAVSDIGTNTFTLSLADTNGWSTTANMNITVAPLPTITATITSRGTNLLLTWSGRKPPYQVQTASELVNPGWQNLGSPTTNTTMLLLPTNAGTFYRIQGQ
jgi:hypothetical protein